MYNEELKNSFLQSLSDQGKSRYIIRNAKNAFNRSEALEKHFDKDIYDFSIDEIRQLYKSFEFGSLSSLTSINYQYIYYVNYCVEHGICNQNVFDAVKRVDIKDCVKQIYYDEMAMTRMESALVNPCDKFILLAPYYGFSTDYDYKDFALLNKKSFNKRRSVITLWDGREIKCTPDMIEIGLKTFDTYKYYQAKGGTNILVGDGIIKVMPKSNGTGQINYENIIQQRYSKVFRKQFMDNNLSFNHVRNSGIINFTNQIIFDECCGDINELWHNNRFQSEIIKGYKVAYNITTFDGVFGQHIRYEMK